MLRQNTRQQVVEYLAQHGPLTDSNGKATAKLRAAIGFRGTEAAFTQMIASMDRAGTLCRDIRGKRTYLIATANGVTELGNDPATNASEMADMDYDKIASALLIRAVQAITEQGKGRASDSAWARRRVDRLDRRIGELESELRQTKAELQMVSAERDQLQIQFTHSEANLALLRGRTVPTVQGRNELSKLLREDEQELLQRLREGP